MSARLQRGDLVKHRLYPGQGKVSLVSPMGQYATVRWGGSLPGQSYLRTHAIADLTRVEVTR